MPEVIIIGAGVVGTSIAYQLAKKGCQDVTVLEKNYVGSGATEKCAGGIRQQFSTDLNIRLSRESVTFFEHFEEETGHTADFRQHGYLMLATSDDELETFRQNVDRQRNQGVEVQLISPQEAAEIVPGLNIKDVTGATFCQTDGYADPYSVVSGFASAARRLGVKIINETEVTGIILSGDRIGGVLTTKDNYKAPVVVNAAGAYAGVVGRMVGLELPICPSRRHLFVTEPVFNRQKRFQSKDGAQFPMVVEFHNGFWLRREGNCLIFGMRNPDEPHGFNTSVDWDFFVDGIAPVASHRYPHLKDTGIMKGQAGLHADTPDCMAIVGEAPGIGGLYLACGFSGHGFMHSPATGRIIADMILGREKTPPEFSALSLDRFQHESRQTEFVFI